MTPVDEPLELLALRVQRAEQLLRARQIETELTRARTLADAAG